MMKNFQLLHSLLRLPCGTEGKQDYPLDASLSLRNFFTSKVKAWLIFSVIIKLVTFPWFVSCLCTPAYGISALEEYVDYDDGYFQYNLERVERDELFTIYFLDMTSQAWHSGEVEPGVWQHWLTIVKPNFLVNKTAILLINEGDADHDEPPEDVADLTILTAMLTDSVVVDFRGVPIAPVTFWDELEGRNENALMARSLDLALTTGDVTWAAILPMVKAVVRAMDATQQFLRGRFGIRVVKRFVLTGHSKRGWATWLTAAVDSRVAGIAPLGHDLLNLKEQIARQQATWEEMGSIWDDYIAYDLFNRLLSDDAQELLQVIDPYYYRERLDMPKLILAGAGDPASNVDAVNLYIDDLPGKTSIFYAPNTGHDNRSDFDTLNTLSAFYHRILRHRSLPAFTWSFEEDGTFEVKGRSFFNHPARAILWTAVNTNRPDFRSDSGIEWAAKTIEKSGPGVFSGQVTVPQTGYKAFYIELVFRGWKRAFELIPFKLTTPAKVLGD